ncbi:hypothetical protein ACERK3_10205 [Phycisphaerales bacterium AB-hyl4]|uniref:Uncharacterized protein n=1 Tax=Natronomicrosphaera hydrolytica TaxID=3242702 RepID=A0ABV4U6R6_9BACT
MLAIPSRVIASSFALVSFAAALLIGLLSGNSAGVLIWRATLVMIACWIIGRIVGAIAQRVVDEHIERYKQEHPIPGDEVEDAMAGVAETSNGEGQDRADRAVAASV